MGLIGKAAILNRVEGAVYHYIEYGSGDSPRMTSPWSMPAVPCANNSLADVPTLTSVTDTSLSAINPSSKSVCGAGTDDAVFGLIGADEERTRQPDSSRSSHHDEPGFRTTLGERQVLEIRPDLEP